MRVVIVGGGFGGVRAALNLANKSGFEVVLISRLPYFEYRSALYRLATGRSKRESAISLSEFFAKDDNVTVLEDDISHIDYKNKTLTGLEQIYYEYDVLILAVGSVTQYFGIKGLAELSYGVHSNKEALSLKNHLHDDLVSGHNSERNYVVVGGGATGVELSGEFASYLRRVRRRHGVNTKFTIDLIELSPKLMPTLPERFSSKIEKRLHRLGIKFYLKTAVEGEDASAIELPKGKIQSHTVVWTAGIANNPLFADNANMFEIGKGGKVVVDQYLAAQTDVYVLGDSALTQYSGMAQTAIHDANFVTKNLKRKQRHEQVLTYVPKKPIYAIPAGPRWAAVLWGKVILVGYAGWILRRLADLRLFLSLLPPSRALAVWRSGSMADETCPICKR